LDVIAPEFAVERALKVDELIVRDLSTLAERGERRVLFNDFENSGIYATFVLFNKDLVPTFAD
jgi:hypothetical protein